MSNELLSQIDPAKWLDLVTEFGSQKLSSPDTLPELKQYTIDHAFDLFNGKLSLSSSAQVGVKLLNAIEDADPLALSNQTTESGPNKPALTHSSTRPLLCTFLNVGALSGGELSTSWKLPLSIKGTGSAEFGLYSYSPYTGSNLFVDVAKTELQRVFRSALSFGDITSLVPGEALAVRWSGTIGVKATLDWAELLGSVLTQLKPLYAENKALTISLSASIESQLSLAISNSFLLVFARRRSGSSPYVVELRKDENRQFGVSAKAGIELKTSLSKQAGDALAQFKISIATQALELSNETLEELTTWLRSDVPAPEQLKPKLDELSVKLLGKIEDSYTEVKAKLTTWLDDLEAKIVAAAENTLKASVEWSFSSIQKNDTLIQASFTLEQLKNDLTAKGHKQLRQGKFEQLLTLLPESKDSFFLNTLQRTKLSRFAFGFSIGNSSFRFQRSSQSTLKWIQNGQGKWLSAFGRDLSQESESKSELASRKVGISANGKVFQAADAQTFANLEFDFSLAYSNADTDTETDELFDYLDTARIWGAAPKSVDATLSIEETLKNRSGKLEFVCSLTVPSATLLQTLGQVDDEEENTDLWGDALALSLQSYKLEPALINLDLRSKVYASAADYVMGVAGRPGDSYTKVKNRVRKSLKQEGFKDLAKLELAVFTALKASGREKDKLRWRRIRNVDAAVDFSLVALQAKFKTELGDLLKIQADFRRILRQENSPLNKKSLEKEIDALLDRFRKIRNSRILFRALGTFIVLKDQRLSSDNPNYQSGLSKAFQVFEYDDNGLKETLSFAQTV